MSRYRTVLDKYPKAGVSRELRTVVRTRELETKGRALYREYKFAEANAAFAEVGKSDPSQRERMAFFCALCQYGQGQDDAAEAAARRLAEKSPDGKVRRDAAEQQKSILQRTQIPHKVLFILESRCCRPSEIVPCTDRALNLDEAEFRTCLCRSFFPLISA